jgi:hypothetical protein
MTPMSSARDGWAGTAPVGSFPRAGQFADLFGNVREWVSDWYAPYVASTVVESDPQGPPEARMHVVRGGGWQSRRTAELSPSGRGFGVPGDQVHDVGIRCASNFGGHTSPMPPVGTSNDAGAETRAAPASHPDIRGRWITTMESGDTPVPLWVDFRQNLGGDQGVPQFAIQQCTEHPGRCVIGTIEGEAERGRISMATFDDGSGLTLHAFVDLGNNRLATADLEFDLDGQGFTGRWTQGSYGRGQGRWTGRRALTQGGPADRADSAPMPAQPTLSPLQARIARNLAACDAYVSQVRRRRARMFRMQRTGDPNLPDEVERNQSWLQRQEDGPFGRALSDLRAIMERWQDQEDEGRSTIRSRAQLMREINSRCQP